MARALSAAWLVLGALPLSASAQDGKCVKDGVQVFPAPGSVIPTNARLILEGIGTEQARVLALMGKELVLKSDDDTVTLKVIRGWKSSAGRAAVVLRPRAILKANKLYRLMLDEPLPNFYLVGQGSELPAWHTGKGADDKPPKWIDKPAVSEGQYQLKGGNPTKFLKFRMQMVEQSPAYLVLSIRRARSASGTQTYFAPVEGDGALVGHDACSGNFTFEDGRAYKATIEAFDAAGNVAPAVPPIEFQAPRQVGP